MEENQNKPLFSLSIDPVIKSHLSETARWGKFYPFWALFYVD